MSKKYGNAPLFAGITAFFMAGLLWAAVRTNDTGGRMILLWGLLSTGVIGSAVTVSALPPKGN
jgi:hypothetical protein